MVIDDFYLSLQYCLLNFNSRMYTDCKVFAPLALKYKADFNSPMYTDCKPINPPAKNELVYFNSRMYTNCKRRRPGL